MTLWATQMENIVLRGKTYHYVRRVPRELQSTLGQKFWKRSLKTGNLRAAEVKARVLGVEIDELIKAHRVASEAAKLAGTAQSAQRNYYNAILAQEHAARRGDYNFKFAKAVDFRARELELAERALAVAKETAVPGAGRLLRQFKVINQQRQEDDVTVAAYNGQPPQPGAWQALLHAYRLQEDEATKKHTLREIEKRAALRPIEEKQLRQDLKPLEAFAPLHDDENNPRVAKVLAIWLAERGQGDSARKRHSVAIARWVAFHGNIPVKEITRKMVEGYTKAIGDLTDHRHLPPSQRGSMLQIDQLPKVSAPTVERHLTTIKALLSFALGKGWVTANPATGVKPPKDGRPKAGRRRSFTHEERKTLMARAIEEFGADGDFTWLIRLGAYTGARLEELAQLSKANVRVIDGVPAIEIDDLDGRKLKNPSSVRQIPLHSAIADNFIRFAADSKHGSRVFASFFKNKTGRFSNALSAEFARLMDRAGLPDSRLVFHSLRHGLKKEMSNTHVDPDARRAILGHTARDAHGEYEGHSLAALAVELNRVPVLF